jgi:hypothetical protein
MKYLLIVLLFLSSCDNRDAVSLTEMERPIIVVAINKESEYKTIVIRDYSGMVYVLNDESTAGSALIASYKVGDTLK